ncbi:MAG: FtsX-like permease family protein [Actinomycetota bacterium]
MLKLTVRGLLAHKIRFALTTFAVVLGVGFVVAAFLISDSLRSTFDDIVGDLNEGVAAEVRGFVEFDDGTGFTPPIDEGLVDTVAAVDGVDAAVPILSVQSLTPVDADGEPVTSLGPPILSVNADDGPDSDTTFLDGAEPGPGEFAADRDAADDAGFVIGETYEVVTDQGREDFVYAGTFRFGEDNVLAGAKVFVFDLGDLQRIAGFPGQVQEIQVYAADGVDEVDLIERISAALPASAEVVSGQEASDEDSADFEEFLSIFSNLLLGFAGVALFVATFLINNTFNIVLGQRVRELALLRAIGAGARQVRSSVLGEALLVGLAASVIGLGVGVLLGFGLVALFDALGFSLPDLTVELRPRTVLVAFGIGVGITMLSSVTPSRRASRIPPVAAMQDGYRFDSGESRRRTVIGSTLGTLGVVLLALGLFVDWDSGTTTLFYVVPGAIGVFVGVTLLSPLFAGPVARAIGRPLRYLPWLGMAGRLAQENSARNRERTSATAGALMIGLALVGMTTVTVESLRTSITESLSTSIQADFFLSTDNFSGFGTGLAESIDASDDFDQVSPFRFGRAQVDGTGRDMLAADLAELDGLVDPDVSSGSLADAGPGTILVHQDPARDLDVTAGDTLTVTYASGESEDLRIAAVYDDATILNNWVIDLESFTQGRFGSVADLFAAARIADGVSIEQAQQTIDELAEAFPQVNVEDQAEYQASIEGQLDSLLAVIFGMLALAILIALLGIANTLALSVFERTREIGLLRAVGMGRRQTRSMVRWEAAIVSAFGALLGVLLGAAFGVAVVTALPDSIISAVTIPVPNLVLFVVIAALAGLVAAFFPARRASKMNVLDAIQHQ